MSEQQTVSRLLVAHLLGGQTLIGSLEQMVVNGEIAHAGPAVMQRPYEVFVLPPENQSESTVTLIKFGTLLGLLPALGSDYADLTNKVLALKAPDQRLLESYHKALDLERNPPTKEQLASMLRPGKTSSTTPGS